MLTVKPLVKTCLMQPSWELWPFGVTKQRVSRTIPCVLRAEQVGLARPTIDTPEFISDNISGTWRGIYNMLWNIIRGQCDAGQHKGGCEDVGDGEKHS
jgi:hypothetical protein